MSRTTPFLRLRPGASAAALLALWLCCGCCAFESRWKAAANAETAGALAPTQPADPYAALDGRWEGRWRSEDNDHTGRLRCIVTRSGPGAWDADFHATFWKVFSYGYRVTLTGHDLPDGGIAFHGDSDLGWLAGGNYHYEGTATAARFSCTYSSKYDHGRFNMSRPIDALAGVPKARSSADSGP